MATPQPIPPETGYVDPATMVTLAQAAAVKAMEQVGKPLSVGLDGMSLNYGSAAEAIQTAQRYLDLLEAQRKLEVQAAPWSLSQVVRG